MESTAKTEEMYRIKHATIYIHFLKLFSEMWTFPYIFTCQGREIIIWTQRCTMTAFPDSISYESEQLSQRLWGDPKPGNPFKYKSICIQIDIYHNSKNSYKHILSQ